MERTSFPSFSRFYAWCGLFLGAVLSALLMQPLRLLPMGWAVYLLAVALYAGLMALGWRIGTGQDRRTKTTHQASAAAQENVTDACPKILDTSVIIDGRILDICKAGFLEGEILIPAFVLVELRHIADSADALRRNRGRRGLDVLNKMQEESRLPVRIEEKDYEDVPEVDVKLLRLAKDVNGAVLTNDYNLNKVAGVTGVKVLNINELAGALRPVVLPGEEMTVHIVRDGKEAGQGVGYLDDGTMVVVENGRRRVGETIDVEVTTVLQTSAGRMIFSRVKMEENKAV
ncbi:MAG: TRAM domain-containing protein [Clostridia bacterium]|nr:TRAM domain-containing protein [Clostridia bacterium]